jgi:hypothetical protein
LNLKSSPQRRKGRKEILDKNNLATKVRRHQEKPIRIDRIPWRLGGFFTVFFAFFAPLR